MIFCRMRKGILKALGPTRAGTPPSLSRASNSANLVSCMMGRMQQVLVRTLAEGVSGQPQKIGTAGALGTLSLMHQGPTLWVSDVVTWPQSAIEKAFLLPTLLLCCPSMSTALTPVPAAQNALPHPAICQISVSAYPLGSRAKSLGKRSRAPRATLSPPAPHIALASLSPETWKKLEG